jgi:hypothetical protein
MYHTESQWTTSLSNITAHRAVSKSIGNYSSTKTGPMPSAPGVH